MISRIIRYECVKVDTSSVLPDGVSVYPTAQRGTVDPVFVDVQVSGGIGPLGRETEGIQGGSRTGYADRFAKRAVFVTGGDVAGCGTD